MLIWVNLAVDRNVTVSYLRKSMCVYEFDLKQIYLILNSHANLKKLLKFTLKT